MGSVDWISTDEDSDAGDGLTLYEGSSREEDEEDDASLLVPSIPSRFSSEAGEDFSEEYDEDNPSGYSSSSEDMETSRGLPGSEMMEDRSSLSYFV